MQSSFHAKTEFLCVVIILCHVSTIIFVLLGNYLYHNGVIICPSGVINYIHFESSFMHSSHYFDFFQPLKVAISCKLIFQFLRNAPKLLEGRVGYTSSTPHCDP